MKTLAAWGIIIGTVIAICGLYFVAFKIGLWLLRHLVNGQ